MADDNASVVSCNLIVYTVSGESTLSLALSHLILDERTNITAIIQKTFLVKHCQSLFHLKGMRVGVVKL